MRRELARAVVFAAVALLPIVESRMSATYKVTVRDAVPIQILDDFYLGFNIDSGTIIMCKIHQKYF